MTVFLDSDTEIDAGLANGFFPPISSGILAYYEFGGDLASSLRNLVQPALPALAVGSVAAVADGLDLAGQSAFIDTQIIGSDEMTVIAVVKARENLADPYQQVMIASSVSGSTGFFFDMRARSPAAAPGGLLSATVFYATAGGVGMDGLTGSSLPDASVYNLVVFSYTAGDGHRIRNLTAGYTLNRPAALAVVPSTSTIRIGAGTIANHEAASRQLRFALYGRALTPTEEDTMAAFIRADLAALATPVIV